MSTLQQLFGGRNVKIIEARVYHEYDEDEGRYRFLLTREDSTTRHSSTREWVGTPDLTDHADVEFLIELGKKTGHIHKRMENYHHEKVKANDHIRLHQQKRYQPEEVPAAAKPITDGSRARARERAFLLAHHRANGTKPPPTDKQKKKMLKKSQLRSNVEKAVLEVKKAKPSKKAETENEIGTTGGPPVNPDQWLDADQRRMCLIDDPIYQRYANAGRPAAAAEISDAAQASSGPQNEGRMPDCDDADSHDGDVDEMSTTEVEDFVRRKKDRDLIAMKRQLDVEIARREARNREHMQALQGKQPSSQVVKKSPPPGFKYKHPPKQPPPPPQFVPKAKPCEVTVEKVPVGFVRKSCGPISNLSPETDDGERKSSRIEKRERETELKQKDKARRKKKRKMTPQHIRQGSEWTIPERTNARKGERADYKERMHQPLVHYVKKQEKDSSSDEEEEKNLYKRPRGRPKGSKNSKDTRLKPGAIKKKRPSNWPTVRPKKQRIPDRPSAGFPDESVETDGTDLNVGDKVWALDVRLIWCLAIVVATTGEFVRVHFHGWPNKFDENVEMGSGKLRKLGKYTGSKLCWPGPALLSATSSDDAEHGEEDNDDELFSTDRAILDKIPAALPLTGHDYVEESAREDRFDLNYSDDDVEDEEEEEEEVAVTAVEVTADSDSEQEGEEMEVEVDIEQDEQDEAAASALVNGPRNEGKGARQLPPTDDDDYECDGPGGYSYSYPTYQPAPYVESIPGACEPAPDSEQCVPTAAAAAAPVVEPAPAAAVDEEAAPHEGGAQGLDVLAAACSSDEEITVASLASASKKKD